MRRGYHRSCIKRHWLQSSRKQICENEEKVEWRAILMNSVLSPEFSFEIGIFHVLLALTTSELCPHPSPYIPRDPDIQGKLFVLSQIMIFWITERFSLKRSHRQLSVKYIRTHCACFHSPPPRGGGSSPKRLETVVRLMSNFIQFLSYSDASWEVFSQSATDGDTAARLFNP